MRGATASHRATSPLHNNKLWLLGCDFSSESCGRDSPECFEQVRFFILFSVIYYRCRRTVSRRYFMRALLGIESLSNGSTDKSQNFECSGKRTSKVRGASRNILRDGDATAGSKQPHRPLSSLDPTLLETQGCLSLCRFRSSPTQLCGVSEYWGRAGPERR
jgi:hypothetical protein